MSTHQITHKTRLNQYQSASRVLEHHRPWTDPSIVFSVLLGGSWSNYVRITRTMSHCQQRASSNGALVLFGPWDTYQKFNPGNLSVVTFVKQVRTLRIKNWRTGICAGQTLHVHLPGGSTSARDDVMAAILKVRRQVENPTQPIAAFLYYFSLPEQSIRFKTI